MINSSSFKVILFTLMLFLFIGCSALKGKQPVVYPLPSESISIKEGKIFQNDKLFAELRYFSFSEDAYLNKPEATRGLAIYYVPFEKEVWISPAEGWSVRDGDIEYHRLKDVQRIWNEYKNKLRDDYPLRRGGEHPSKEDIVTAGARDIHISDDGKIVHYKIPGLFFDSSKKYYVELGISK